MSYDFSSLKQKSKNIREWLVKELSLVRTGRAAPGVLDSVSVETYGSRLSLKELGSLSVEDARTLRLILWDKNQTKAVEKAILASNLGLSVTVDDQGLRVIFPELSSERRETFVRLVKAKLEQAKISLRNLRDEVWRDIQKKERGKEISEDEKFRLKNEMQKIVDGVNKELEADFIRKEREILA